MAQVKKGLISVGILLAIFAFGPPLLAETRVGSCADQQTPGLQEADLPRPFAIGTETGGAGADLDPVDQVGDEPSVQAKCVRIYPDLCACVAGRGYCGPSVCANMCIGI